MTYRELYEKATRQLEHNEITLGEYEKMTKPLDREIEERKVGKWIGTCRIGFGEFAECEVELIDGFVADNCHCSECGEELEKGERGIYCPNCGAEMRGTENG